MTVSLIAYWLSKAEGVEPKVESKNKKDFLLFLILNNFLRDVHFYYSSAK